MPIELISEIEENKTTSKSIVLSLENNSIKKKFSIHSSDLECVVKISELEYGEYVDKGTLIVTNVELQSFIVMLEHLNLANFQDIQKKQL